MENKILFINACVRDESRTLELSHCLLDSLDGEMTEVNLYNENFLPLAENFFKIDDVKFFAAEGLDVFGADVDAIMNEAKKRISNLS